VSGVVMAAVAVLGLWFILLALLGLLGEAWDAAKRR
jgi:hypothetical protein